MHKLAVPFRLEQIETYGIDGFIKALHDSCADTVFLSIGTYQVDKVKRKKIFESLRKNIELLKKENFTVGVWLWTFMFDEGNGYTHIKSINGEVIKEQVCPSDKDFCSFAYDYLVEVAKCQPDMIMFDDDFRYGFLDCKFGCTCHNHRRYMEEISGEKLPENLNDYILKGGSNKYRSAFLEANGHFLKEFACLMRKAVDSVNPKIRLGQCACMSSFDFDGVNAFELSKILAGDTKPFCRLIGAPYLATNHAWGNRLQDVVDLHRMESSWSDGEIELFAEGDTFPRPRFACSSNMLECFDMAIRASDATNGILKYMLDYYGEATYEDGYILKHIENQEIYRRIDKHFSEKTDTGVRVFENMTKFEHMNVASYYSGSEDVQYTFFSPASKMMSANTIPITYTGEGICTVVFGENAKYLDYEELSKDFILDITAAKILTGRRIDVGLESIGENYKSRQEYFPHENRYVGLFGCNVKDIEVKQGAKILSVDKDRNTVISYSYKNPQGQNFLVFAFDGYEMNDHAYKQYARGEEIANWIEETGKKLPAKLLKNPDCHMICKENEVEKSVWITNCFSDECVYKTVFLDGEYKEIEFINCNGRLDGYKVIIDEISPYKSVGFTVKK